MAIIAILVLLAAPRFIGYTKDARVTAMVQDTKVLEDAAVQHHVNHDEWPIDDTKDPITFGVGGVEYLLPLDEELLEGSVNTLGESIDDYGIAVEGSHAGEVFHVTGTKGRDGKRVYAKTALNSDPIIFQGDTYDSVRDIPESPTTWFTFSKLADEDAYEVTGLNPDLNKPITDIAIPSSYKGLPVVKIADGSDAASTFTGMKVVIIPDSITTIGICAFHQNKLTFVSIPDSVTHINYRAFQQNQLTSLVLPASVRHLGAWAFRYNKLESLILLGPIEEWSSGVFNNNRLPDDQAFIYGKGDPAQLISYGGLKRKDVNIPEGVETVDDWAFYDTKIQSVTLPETVVKLGYMAFGVNPLTQVKMPASVKKMEPYAFSRVYNWNTLKGSHTLLDAQPTGPWTGTWVNPNNTTWQKATP